MISWISVDFYLQMYILPAAGGVGIDDSLLLKDNDGETT